MKIGEIFIRDVVSHPQPSGMIYCRGLNKMGYNPYYLPYENNISLDQIDYNYDSSKTTILFDDAYSIPDNSSHYDFDISFVGSTVEGNRHLNIWYDPLSNNDNYKTFFSGFYNYPTTPFEQTYKIYNTSKINLNPHYSHQFGEDKGYGPIFDFNARTFALAGMGCFQLSNHPYYKTIFGDDIPIFDENNFIELINYYLKNDDERNKISSKMQQIVLDKHTTECRIKTLLEL